MKIVRTIKETREFLESSDNREKVSGFVPTMGALHEGHLALVRRAKAECGIVVCSIFVNPTQFNNREDLVKYPRTFSSDVKMLESVGCDLLFAPEVEEMYPDGESATLALDFGTLDKEMEGKFRPGHFQGVATIVHRFFEIVRPAKAYFGKKDYQQLAVIREMTRQMEMPLVIIACETVREPDGLAMSSRNMRLSISERQTAPLISQVLAEVKRKKGTRPVRELAQWAARQIEKDPAFRVEYFSIAHCDTLQPLESWREKDKAVALTAVYLGDVRLIDNLELFS